MPFIAQQVRAARQHLQKSDPVMKSLLTKHGPFTAKAKTDRFGTLVSSIISQQISTAAASTIKQRLHQAIMDRAGKKTLPSVSAEHLLQFDLDSFREIGISRQKATYLIDLATKVSEGKLDLKKLGRLDDEQIIEQLIEVKGIGRWTAQMFLMFSMPDWMSFPSTIWESRMPCSDSTIWMNRQVPNRSKRSPRRGGRMLRSHRGICGGVWSRFGESVWRDYLERVMQRLRQTRMVCYAIGSRDPVCIASGSYWLKQGS